MDNVVATTAFDSRGVVFRAEVTVGGRLCRSEQVVSWHVADRVLCHPDRVAVVKEKALRDLFAVLASEVQWLST